MATARKTNASPDEKQEKSAREIAFLERAAIANAPAWRPGEGDVLSGEVIGFRAGHTEDFGDYPVIILDGDKGPVAFHCFHSIVRERLRELQPKKGTLLTVQYTGQRESNKRQDSNGEPVKYHGYYIECGSPEDAAPVLDEMTF